MIQSLKTKEHQQKMNGQMLNAEYKTYHYVKILKQHQVIIITYYEKQKMKTKNNKKR